MKQITLPDILTPSEVERAREMYAESDGYQTTFHRWLLKELVEPNMARINTATGQENDPRYIAYAIEYALMRENHKPERYREQWRGSTPKGNRRLI